MMVYLIETLCPKFIFVVESGMGATLNVAKPKKGSTVAIFGLGGVGLAVSINKDYVHEYTLSLRLCSCVYTSAAVLFF